MTIDVVQNITPSVQYVATAGQTVYPYPFPIIDNTDLVVLVNAVATGAYNVTGAGGDTGGNITLSTPSTAGDIVTIYRNIPIVRVTQYQQNGPFTSAAINGELDNIYLILQQLAFDNGLALKVPITNIGPPVTTLTPAQYANAYLAFDANGNPTPAALTSSGNITTALLQPFVAPILAPYQASVTSALASLNTATTAVTNALGDLDNVETLVTALNAGTTGYIATFGDSTMWGANPSNLATQVATPPYMQLQNFLNTFMGNTACVVTNFAISGTTCAQMLAGTDGSGLTFAARIAATNASVVYCNHGVNDAFGANSYAPATYRANLLQFVAITRAAGKTPVLVTPHPCLTIGGFGSYARAAATARFAQIMREVAQRHGVILVDNNLVLSKLIAADNDSNQVNLNSPLNILSDGVHGPQTTYYITGNNLADAILGSQIPTLTRDGQYLGAATAACQAVGENVSTTTVSRTGAVVSTGSVSPQTMTICFRVGDTGLDISLLHYIWSGGSTAISVNLDGQGAGATTFPSGISTFSQYAGNFSSTFLQDVETVFIRNCPVGLHLLTLTTSAAGAVSFNGLRARSTRKPTIIGSTGIDLGHRDLLVQKFEMIAGVSNSIAMTDIAVSRFIDGLELEWTAQMTANSGLAICASSGTNTGTNSPQQLLIFGLNGAGYAAVSECTGPGTFTTTALDSTSHLGASHVYRVIVTSASPGSAQMFVDDVSVGTVALTQPYYGGKLGCWKNLSTDNLQFQNISRVWRY